MLLTLVWKQVLSPNFKITSLNEAWKYQNCFDYIKQYQTVVIAKGEDYNSVTVTKSQKVIWGLNLFRLPHI